MTEVGNVYGESLYELAKEENLTQEIGSQLKVLQQSFRQESGQHFSQPFHLQRRIAQQTQKQQKPRKYGQHQKERRVGRIHRDPQSPQPPP